MLVHTHQIVLIIQNLEELLRSKLQLLQGFKELLFVDLARGL